MDIRRYAFVAWSILAVACTDRNDTAAQHAIIRQVATREDNTGHSQTPPTDAPEAAVTDASTGLNDEVPQHPGDNYASTTFTTVDTPSREPGTSIPEQSPHDEFLTAVTNAPCVAVTVAHDRETVHDDTTQLRTIVHTTILETLKGTAPESFDVPGGLLGDEYVKYYHVPDAETGVTYLSVYAVVDGRLNLIMNARADGQNFYASGDLVTRGEVDDALAARRLPPAGERKATNHAH